MRHPEPRLAMARNGASPRRKMVVWSGTNVLRLTSDRAGRCTVSLWVQGQAYELGIDHEEVVASRLAAALVPRLPPSRGMVGGMPVAQLLTLADHSVTIYAGEEDGQRWLLVRRGDERILARIALPPTVRKHWRQELARFTSTR